jgi:hypothetical protein
MVKVCLIMLDSRRDGCGLGSWCKIHVVDIVVMRLRRGAAVVVVLTDPRNGSMNMCCQLGRFEAFLGPPA